MTSSDMDDTSRSVITSLHYHQCCVQQLLVCSSLSELLRLIFSYQSALATAAALQQSQITSSSMSRNNNSKGSIPSNPLKINCSVKRCK
ncbi:hypothetical protein QQF64_027734 [Cirrhinus molitorella]|uniref:Uncharacterized protein n=1 Tax=Cirrhinus molitorella TaxID=172907 RepID=A0ABR3ND94_9TELE